MFRKASQAEEKSRNKLGGGDVKKLRSELAKQLPALSSSALDRLVPKKADVTVVKCANKALVYLVGEPAQPIFFDPDGRGGLFPTVYVLWEVEGLLPSMPTHSEVSPRVLGGADFMLPGLKLGVRGAAQLGEWERGDKRCITIPENPYPFAVGPTQGSSEEAQENNLKGKGIKTLHTYGDLLWAMGDKSRPSASFTPERIFPEGDDDGAAGGGGDDGIVFGEGSADEGEGAAADNSDGGAEIEEFNVSVFAKKKKKKKKKVVVESSSSESESEEDEPAKPSGPADEDGRDMCEVVFVRALAALPDVELPVVVSQFWSSKVLPARPEGTSLDIKASPFKKLAKLLKTLEKKKILKSKMVRKEDTIIAVDRSHADILRATTVAASDGGACGKGKGKGSGAEVNVEELYKPTSNLRPIFEAQGAGRDALFSAAQVRASLIEYAEDGGLFDGAARHTLTLDQTLAKELYGKKEPQSAGDEEDVDALLARVMGKLKLHHRVSMTRDGETSEHTRKGKLEPVNVTVVDREKGRKYTTKITNLESFGIDAQALAADLKSKLSIGASVAKDVHKSKDDDALEVSMQGNNLEEVTSFLRKEYGLPAAFIKGANKCK